MARRETASQFDPRRLTSDLESYRNGSLLYMYLENFVTYDEVAIYPGAHMNMVMGPNGAGKSSLVAAMAIGLGWSPGILGRSKDVFEFIKYNTSRAVVEMALRIEPEISSLARDGPRPAEFDWALFGLDGRPECGYVVVRRELVGSASGARKASHSSEWQLDGRVAQYTHIRALTRWLNIQCDNLCQFLPQDRVSEFARMTPVELLRETEKAAAAPEVLEAHVRLAKLQVGLRLERGSLESAEKSLDSLNKQASVVTEVLERHRAHEEHVQMVRLCEKKRPWLEYNAARNVYLRRRELRDDAKKRLDLALVDVEPLRTREQDLAQRTKLYERARQQTQAKLERRRKAVDDATGRFSNVLGGEIRARRGEFLQVRTSRAKKQQEMQAKRAEILCYQEVAGTDMAPVRAEHAAKRERLTALSRQLGELDQEVHALDQQARLVQRDAEGHVRDLEVAEAELANLDDVKKIRFDVLRRKNPTVANAALWLQQHRSEFPSVHGPVCLELNASRPNLAAAVENSIGLAQMMQFVSDSDREADEFLDRILREHGWRVNMAVVSPHAAQQAINDRPVLRRELQEAGFEGFAFDYIDAPDLIKYSLLDSARILQVPIALGRLHRPVDALPAGALAGIRKLVTPELRYEVNTSRYSADRVLRSQELRAADFLRNSVDEAAKTAVRARIEAIRGQQRGCELRLREALASQEPIRRSVDRLQVEKAAVEREKQAAEARLREHAVASKRLENAKAQLKDMGDSLAELAEEPIRARLVELFHARKKAAMASAKALQEYRSAFAEVIEGQLEDSLNTSELARVRARVAELEGQQEALKEASVQAEHAFVQAKNEAKDLLKKANRIPIDDELRRAFADLPETLGELDVRIAQEQARSELLQGASGAGRQARDNLVRLNAEIAALERSVAGHRRAIASFSDEIAATRAQWYPCVVEMVQRIDSNFRRFFAKLDCLGEVRLEEHGEEYDQWEIAILVRFRDEEALQRLSAQRQSGGEKSVSTILYLLALQELSKSPFRVVDEINQGMDASNERRVHALIVDTATSAENRSQYFLITPKLLTNLSYHENMHVLCVYNGEGMPLPEVWRSRAFAVH